MKSLVTVLLALMLPAFALGQSEKTETQPASENAIAEKDTTKSAEATQDSNSTGEAEESEVAPVTPAGIRLGKEPAKYRWKVGFKMVTRSAGCRDVVIAIPVPTEWPEQEVMIDEESIPNSIHDISYRELESGVQQWVAKLGSVPGKTIIEADITFKVSVKEIFAPRDTTKYSIAKKPDRDLKQYLGISPGITYRNSKLRREVKKIVATKDSAWEQIEALYDWVRDNVEYREGEVEGNLSAYRSKQACAEDLVGLFIAMCRCHKVPARMVWVEGHQLAEFYLVDDDGKGHWFPCNVAGLRDFGSNSDPRIILQKGDNVKVPEKETRQKYVAEFATASGKSKPAIGFVRELLPD